ncbi:MAG: glycosyltransferase family 2 protein [Chitinophagaceae bacterium]|nr:glycosyltransferase family 2 protein [Chitinophagaceae bacterium]
MKVAGFTIIRNAVKYDYPIIESITSLLPICDVFIIAVGNSDDGTLELIKSINDPKINIVETVWDDTKREGGSVLADETNKAISFLPKDVDWAFYIQGDEVLHEKYHQVILQKMKQYLNNDSIDGLLFDYVHFYGSYNYVGSSLKWYAHEIRIIKPNRSIYSYLDAQGFRKGKNEKLNVKPVDASIYHYGWVKEPEVMQKKIINSSAYWHSDQWIEKNIAKDNSFDYLSIDQLELFKGTHPKVMQKRIEEKNWEFDYDISFNKITTKERLKKWLYKYLGINTSYQNYKLK